MKVLIVTEVRIFHDNKDYYCSEPFYKILERYSKAFHNLCIYTRIVNTNKSVPNGFIKVSLPDIKFENSKSIIQSVIPYKKDIIKKEIKACDLVILRVPSITSTYVYRLIKKDKKRYMVEVMGCAWDDYWNHSLKTKPLALYGFLKMKTIVYNANYAIYVTRDFLQRRYPCKNKTTYASNVKIDSVDEETISKRVERIHSRSKKSISLMTSAAIDVRYKGQKYVILAIPVLKELGYHIKYYLAGSGEKKYLQKYIKRYNLERDVVFLGALNRNEVFKYLNSADLYIQPSLQEGLPRAVVEAMSTGCPVIGTNTAGIPELVQSNMLVAKRSYRSIAKKIIEYENYSKPEKIKISRQNFETSKQYLDSILNDRRSKFYKEIKNDIIQ